MASWRFENQRADIQIHEAGTGCPTAEHIGQIESAWRRFTMPSTDCKTARMSEWRRIIGWLFSETTGLGGQPRICLLYTSDAADE